MSKLSLMIFTFVILAIILCNHSACSRKRPGNFPYEPGNCPSCFGKLGSLMKSQVKHWKCNMGNVACICWKIQNGSYWKRCSKKGGGLFYKVSTPL